TPGLENWPRFRTAGPEGQPSGTLSHRPRDELLQLRMYRGRSSDIFAALERAIAAAIIGDEPPGLADQQHARGRVPQVEGVFPIAVHPPRRDPGEVECRRAEAADAGDVRSNGGVDLRPLFRIAASDERDSGADQA